MGARNQLKGKNCPDSKPVIIHEKGEAGPAGATGPAGPAGPSGPAGRNGLNGSTGSTGPAGPAGGTGPAGPKGEDGEDGVGIKGDKGDKGDKGEDGAAGAAGGVGAQGPTGPKGEDGKGACETISEASPFTGDCTQVQYILVQMTDGTCRRMTPAEWTACYGGGEPPENNPPVFSGCLSLVCPPGQLTVTGQLTATDPDGDTLTYGIESVTPAAPGLTVNAATGAVSGSVPNLDQTYQVVLFVSDGRGGYTTCNGTISKEGDNLPVRLAANATADCLFHPNSAPLCITCGTCVELDMSTHLGCLVDEDPWEVVSVSGLPDGLQWNSAAVRIDGTPTSNVTLGLNTVTFTVVDPAPAGSNSPQTFTFQFDVKTAASLGIGGGQPRSWAKTHLATDLHFAAGPWTSNNFANQIAVDLNGWPQSWSGSLPYERAILEGIHEYTREGGNIVVIPYDQATYGAPAFGSWTLGGSAGVVYNGPVSLAGGITGYSYTVPANGNVVHSITTPPSGTGPSGYWHYVPASLANDYAAAMANGYVWQDDQFIKNGPSIHQDYIDTLDPFGWFRFMHLNRANSLDHDGTAANRPLPGTPFYDRGISYEWIAELMNRANVNGWVNPQLRTIDALRAGDTYLYDMANYLALNTNSGLQLNTEIANETWNTAWQFNAQSDWVWQNGPIPYDPNDATVRAFNHYERQKELSDVFQQVYEQNGRGCDHHGVMGVHVENEWLGERRIKGQAGTGLPDSVDKVAITYYVGQGFNKGGPTYTALSNAIAGGQNTDALIDDILRTGAGLSDQQNHWIDVQGHIQNYIPLVLAEGAKLVEYEGGDHFNLNGITFDNADAQDLLIFGAMESYRNSGLYKNFLLDMYTYLKNVAIQAEIIHYVHTGPNQPNSPWGEYSGPFNGPRYADAHQAFLEYVDKEKPNCSQGSIGGGGGQTNTAPTITACPNATLNANETTHNYVVSATDAEGPVTFSLVSVSPSGPTVNVNATSGAVAITGMALDETYSVAVQACDSEGLCVTCTSTVTTQTPVVNCTDQCSGLIRGAFALNGENLWPDQTSPAELRVRAKYTGTLSHLELYFESVTPGGTYFGGNGGTYEITVRDTGGTILYTAPIMAPPPTIPTPILDQFHLLPLTGTTAVTAGQELVIHVRNIDANPTQNFRTLQIMWEKSSGELTHQCDWLPYVKFPGHPIIGDQAWPIYTLRYQSGDEQGTPLYSAKVRASSYPGGLGLVVSNTQRVRVPVSTAGGLLKELGVFAGKYDSVGGNLAANLTDTAGNVLYTSPLPDVPQIGVTLPTNNSTDDVFYASNFAWTAVAPNVNIPAGNLWLEIFAQGGNTYRVVPIIDGKLANVWNYNGDHYGPAQYSTNSGSTYGNIPHNGGDPRLIVPGYIKVCET